MLRPLCLDIGNDTEVTMSLKRIKIRMEQHVKSVL